MLSPVYPLKHPQSHIPGPLLCSRLSCAGTRKLQSVRRGERQTCKITPTEVLGRGSHKRENAIPTFPRRSGQFPGAGDVTKEEEAEFARQRGCPFKGWEQDVRSITDTKAQS